MRRNTMQMDVEASLSSRWWREEELINQRLTWLLSAHALLGAGYAWLKNRVAEIEFDLICKNDTGTHIQNAKEIYTDELLHLMHFLAGIGIFLSFLVGLGVVAACMAQNRLKQDHRNKQYQLGVSSVTTNIGRCTALCFPCACIFAWIYIAIPKYYIYYLIIVLFIVGSVAIYLSWESDKNVHK